MMNRSLSRSRRAGRPVSGFTLIEVLLVLVILVILGSIAVPMFSGVGEQANLKAARVQVDMLESAINTYKGTTLMTPNSLDELISAPSNPTAAAKWAGPYLPANRDLIDPWGNPYKFNPKGTKSGVGFDVYSLGPDGQDGSEDDIGNWPAAG
jgi:general secretion pathway protein G